MNLHIDEGMYGKGHGIVCWASHGVQWPWKHDNLFSCLTSLQLHIKLFHYVWNFLAQWPWKHACIVRSCRKVVVVWMVFPDESTIMQVLFPVWFVVINWISRFDSNINCHFGYQNSLSLTMKSSLHGYIYFFHAASRQCMQLLRTDTTQNAKRHLCYTDCKEVEQTRQPLSFEEIV